VAMLYDYTEYDDTMHLQVVEIKPLKGASASTGVDMYVAELFHGPSLAFKDLGMQVINSQARPMRQCTAHSLVGPPPHLSCL
jgi:threonine synthase